MDERIQTVSYWDAQARWQKTWLERCDYHREIISLISRRTFPGWRVLDIGAGSGVLALPLKKLGCQMTALEPSVGMRALLREMVGYWYDLTIDGRSWERMPVSQARGYELILACNSLHLTSVGFGPALAKIFRAGPRHVCVVSETRFVAGAVPRRFGKYYLRWQRQLKADSSLAYRSLKEVWEHFQHRWGRLPTTEEKEGLEGELSYGEGCYWLRQEAQISVWWWSKRREVNEGRLSAITGQLSALS